MYDEKSEDSHRIRAGLITLLIGVFLLLWVWMMIMLSSPQAPIRLNTPMTHQDASGEPQRSSLRSPEDEDVARVLQGSLLMLTTGLVLVLVFIIGSYVLVRGSRRFAASIVDRPSKPTPTSDVWSMHVLPEDRPRRRDSEP